MPQNLRCRIADVPEALRSRLTSGAEREHRSLFDLDERLIELMDRLEDSIAEAGEAPPELQQEIGDYLEAIRTKVDRIAGYWRWQESIAAVCASEAERFDARKRAANGRVERLKSMLLAFILPRDLKKVEGQKAAIGMRANGTASLVIDDPAQIAGEFFEYTFPLSMSESRELAAQLPEGPFRRRVEAAIAGDGWEINASTSDSEHTPSSELSSRRCACERLAAGRSWCQDRLEAVRAEGLTAPPRARITDDFFHAVVDGDGAGVGFDDEAAADITLVDTVAIAVEGQTQVLMDERFSRLAVIVKRPYKSDRTVGLSLRETRFPACRCETAQTHRSGQTQASGQ